MKGVFYNFCYPPCSLLTICCSCTYYGETEPLLSVFFGITPIKKRFTVLVSLQQDDKGTILASNRIFFDEGTKENSKIWLYTNNCLDHQKKRLDQTNCGIRRLSSEAGIDKKHQYGSIDQSQESHIMYLKLGLIMTNLIFRFNGAKLWNDTI